MRKHTWEVFSPSEPPREVSAWFAEKEDCDTASKLNGDPRECKGVRDPETGHVCDGCRGCRDYAYRKDYGEDEYYYSEGDEE